jgi:hypothetical protein
MGRSIVIGSGGQGLIGETAKQQKWRALPALLSRPLAQRRHHAACAKLHCVARAAAVH